MERAEEAQVLQVNKFVQKNKIQLDDTAQIGWYFFADRF